MHRDELYKLIGSKIVGIEIINDPYNPNKDAVFIDIDDGKNNIEFMIQPKNDSFIEVILSIFEKDSMNYREEYEKYVRDKVTKSVGRALLILPFTNWLQLKIDIIESENKEKLLINKLNELTKNK